MIEAVPQHEAILIAVKEAWACGYRMAVDSLRMAADGLDDEGKDAWLVAADVLESLWHGRSSEAGQVPLPPPWKPEAIH